MEESLSDTAATVLSCPAGCPLALFSCENLFTADRNSLNQKVWHLAGTRQTWCYTLNFWSTAFSSRFSSPNFPTIQMPSQSCQKYLHAKTHHGFCVSVDCGRWCFALTKRHLSGGRQGKKRKGVGDYFASWVVCPHLWENSIFTFCN